MSADLFFGHNDLAVLAAAQVAGLVCRNRGDADDAIGRSGYDWCKVAFSHYVNHDRTESYDQR